MISAAGSLLNYPGDFSTFSFSGLQDQTLFDVLQPNDAVDGVTVNGTTFNVTCGTLSNVTFTPHNGTTWTNATMAVSWDINLGVDNFTYTFPNAITYTREIQYYKTCD